MLLGSNELSDLCTYLYRQQHTTETNHYETVQVQHAPQHASQHAVSGSDHPGGVTASQAQLRAAPGAPHGPHTATRELDDLMASLSEFKVCRVNYLIMIKQNFILYHK